MTRFEITVPRCCVILQKTPCAPALIAGPRGWVCPVHDGYACAAVEQHRALKVFRGQAASHRLSVKVTAWLAKHPGSSLRDIADAFRDRDGSSPVPRLLRYLCSAGLVIRDASGSYTVSS